MKRKVIVNHIWSTNITIIEVRDIGYMVYYWYYWQLEENGEVEASPSVPVQNYAVPQNFAVRAPMAWQPWNGPRYRGARGPWRGPRGPNNHGYFRAPGRGRGFVYYDPNQAMYQVRTTAIFYVNYM